MHKLKWWFGGAGALAAAGIIYWSAPDQPRPSPAELGAGVAHHAAHRAAGGAACEEPLRAVPSELPAAILDACPASEAGGIRQTGIAALEVIDLSPALERPPVMPAVYEEPPIADGIMPAIGGDEPGGTTVPMIVPAGGRVDQEDLPEVGTNVPVLFRRAEKMPYCDEMGEYIFYPGTLLRVGMEQIESYRTTRMPCYRKPTADECPADEIAAFPPVLGFCEAYLGAMGRLIMESDAQSAAGEPGSQPTGSKAVKPASYEDDPQEQAPPSVIRVVPKGATPECCKPKIDTMEVRPGDVLPVPFGPF